MKGVIRIEGEIGSQVTLETVRSQISPKYTSYEILIDSPGGEVFTGYSIYNELRRINKPKTTIITGLCASIATLIAGAGDRIKMFNVSQYMIHNPSVGMEGDANDLRKGADTLDQIKQTLISVYEKRTRKAGIGRDQLWQMLDEETFLLPETAKELGFIDEVIYDVPEEVMNKARELKAVAYIDINKVRMSEKKEQRSMIERLTAQFEVILKTLRSAADLPKEGEQEKVTNNLNLTLEDGTAVIVVTEDDTWEGKQVTFEDGTPLSPGEYTTADGVKFQVDENSTITTVTQPDTATDDKKDKEGEKPSAEEMKQIEELKAQVEQLKKELEAKNTEAAAKEKEVATANENFKKFEATLKAVQEELTKIKTTTAGDKDDPAVDAHDKKLDEKELEFDPMAESWGRAFVSRQQVNFN